MSLADEVHDEVHPDQNEDAVIVDPHQQLILEQVVCHALSYDYYSSVKLPNMMSTLSVKTPQSSPLDATVD